MREKWIALACTGMLAACSAGKPPPPRPPPQVGVLTLKSEPVTITTELPCRTVAYRIAEVRPQVSGVVQKRLFKEGGAVTAGQQLAVMLVVPLGVLGAILATLARGLSNDVFFQVGLLTTVGLSAKTRSERA